MAAQVARLSGEDWQSWANKLLTCHYGPTEYQTVPDNDKGDAGIEGFTILDGHVYQAYGCEEPLTTTERFEAQRDKMTKDIGKFINNAAVLAKIFGAVKIKRWVLFVPYYDSKNIVAHAAKKTAEVLQANLPYVANEFRVVVCQEDDFAVERDQLLNAGSRSLEIEATAATKAQITQWASSNDGLSSTLQEKIERLPTIKTDAHRKAFHDQVLTWYLNGQEIYEALRKYPEVYAKVRRAKSHRENFLAMANVSGAAPQNVLHSALKDLLEAFQVQVKELHAFSAEALSHEAIADWLLRCPLDFPEADDNV